MAISNSPKGDGSDAGSVRLTGSALLRVVTDLGPAVDAKQKLAPNAPTDIFMFGRRAALKGRVNSIDEAVDMANIAQTYSPGDQPPINSSTLAGSNQINIRVRFAEVSRSDLKSFGIDWNVGVQAGSFNRSACKSRRRASICSRMSSSGSNRAISTSICSSKRSRRMAR